MYAYLENFTHDGKWWMMLDRFILAVGASEDFIFVIQVYDVLFLWYFLFYSIIVVVVQ